MNTILTRDVTVFQRLETSSFTEANNKIFGVPDRYVTANEHAQKQLLSKSDFLNAILPTIISMDNKVPEWSRVMHKYFYEFTLLVNGTSGKKLDTSLIYNIDDTTKAAAIKNLNKKVTTSEDLKNYVEANVAEIDKYRYATPVNHVDYFAYIFCLNSSEVANSLEDVKRSNKIGFYLITKESIAKQKIAARNISKEIRKYLTQIDEKPELFKHMCRVLEIEGDTDIDKYVALETLSTTNPTKFLEAVTDKDLKHKSMIIEYIKAGILYKIPNSGVIVDATDRSIIIGNNMKDAISFFANTANVDYVNTIQSQLKVQLRQSELESKNK